QSLTSPFHRMDELHALVERMLLPTGRSLDLSRPFNDGVLPDGSRFHIVSAPASPLGPTIAIRRHARHGQLGLQNFGSERERRWLVERLQEGCNLLIAGPTGSGKTTLLGKLLDEIPYDCRLLILEEAMEIQTQHPHCVRLETRPPSADGRGGVSLQDLVR